MLHTSLAWRLAEDRSLGGKLRHDNDKHERCQEGSLRHRGEPPARADLADISGLNRAGAVASQAEHPVGLFKVVEHGRERPAERTVKPAADASRASCRPMLALRTTSEQV